MMHQGAVPNTYAAGLASLAAWKKRKATAAQNDEQPIVDGTLCECGRPRPKGPRNAYNACERCKALDLEQDPAILEDLVRAAFVAQPEYSLTELIEALRYKHARHEVYRVLCRLIAAGELARRHAVPRTDGFVYTRP